MRVLGLVLAAALAFPAAAGAAPDGKLSLADLRQQLTVLYAELQRLKSELSTTGAPETAKDGGPIARLDAIEAEVERLTDRTEKLSARIDKVVEDGTDRVADLEYRLCELEADCDPADLDETTPLGGVDVAKVAPAIPETPAAKSASPELAVGERAAFDAARTALSEGATADAAARFKTFLDSYPASPLAAEAQFRRGEALTAEGRTKAAARAYLASFSGAPAGPFAPRALLALGRALDGLGQQKEACTTLGEVGRRFPDSDSAAKAGPLQSEVGCG